VIAPLNVDELYVHAHAVSTTLHCRVARRNFTVMLVLSTSATFASPCSQEIDRVQASIDAKLEAQAAAGHSARESTAATMHRQPTPGSIAAAGARLGEVSSEKVHAVEVLMTQAREAERVDDQSTCEQALTKVQSLLDF
jgi:hypothetical protein